MIVITGASSGLGAELAQQYGKEGHTLALTGRDTERLDAVKGVITTSTDTSVTTHAVDLSSADEASQLFDAIDTTPNLVIHCAGSGYFGPIEQQEPCAIEQLLKNNINTSVFLLRELVKRYRDQEITVAVVMSTAAQAGKAGESTYCAAKWAVKGLVESVRYELKGYPMQIVAVYPGGMATEFWSTSGKDIDVSQFMTAEEAAKMLKQALTSTEHGLVSDITINRR